MDGFWLVDCSVDGLRTVAALGMWMAYGMLTGSIRREENYAVSGLAQILSKLKLFGSIIEI